MLECILSTLLNEDYSSMKQDLLLNTSDQAQKSFKTKVFCGERHVFRIYYELLDQQS